MMKAKFRINDTFIITGRGLVFLGKIDQGLILTGDFIEFEAFQIKRRRKIKGVEFTSTPNNDLNISIGLLIECKDQNEIDELRGWKPNGELAVITEL